MGQRSQIYVRYNKKLVVANYYQWNYGERMISRAKYGIEYIKDVLLQYKDWIFNDNSYMLKLRRMFEVNFDVKDIQISIDIVQEWKELQEMKENSCENNFNDIVFEHQVTNDGNLFIDISEDGTIKYAFLDNEFNLEHIMDVRQYMAWDCEAWENSEYIDDEQKKRCKENMSKIENMAVLMSKEEVEDYINYDYLGECNPLF